ncbi:MAG: MlaD family protein [Prevotellaceae bacterium]|jgi:phospholipid/cholesterol/gamma-HCH transport system substrate-binding protein|nr:MlaD family protein [Prevotellaceae bacterium]
MKIKREVKIGLFFLAIVVAIFGLLNFLKGQDIFKHANPYYAVYENVEGLSPSSQVFLKGLRIGAVEKITFDAASLKFIIKININDKYHIPKNSEAQIFNTDIMGNKALRIVFGDSDHFLQKGDTLLAGNVPELITMIADELVPLKQKVDTLVSALNTTAQALNAILTEETQKNLVSGIASLRKTLHNLQSFSAALENEKGNIKNIAEGINTFMGSLNQSSGDITRTLHNLALLTDSLQSADLKATVESINALLSQANNPEGSIGKLLHDGHLYNNVSKTVAHLDSLIIAIQRNPKKYIKISVF